MARILLDISNGPDLITLKAMLEAEGHRIENDIPEAIITDDATKAVARAGAMPTLLLARAADIASAVRAMRQGVFGYIFLPLQPGEAAIMVERALAGGQSAARETDPVSMTDAENQLLLDTLRRCKGNKTKAAQVLGIGRNTLWRKLKKLR